MKYNKIIFLFLVMVYGYGFSQHKNFNYKRKANAIAQEGWYAIQLPADIFAHCNRDFRDFRLYNINGSDTVEAPYLLKKRTSEIKRVEIDLTAINRSKKDGVLFITFELNPEQKVNFIDLEFEENNYFAFVRIEGSQNNKEWFEIVDKQRILSLHNANDAYQYNTVTFPTANFKYLRVSVASDTRLTFKHASFRDEEIKKGTFVNIPSTWRATQDKKTKQTVVDINLDHYRPVSDLTVEISNDKDYYRALRIDRLADSTQTPKGWIKNYETVNEGYLTSFRPNEFSIDNELMRALKLTINNYDNQPLEVKSIQVAGPVIELVALLKPGETYIFYGNNWMDYPTYDIAHFEEKIPKDLPKVELGPEQNIAAPVEKVSALFENKAWLWAIMVVVIGTLGFFTLKMMKSNAPA
jgi:hypothetical protein